MILLSMGCKEDISYNGENTKALFRVLSPVTEVKAGMDIRLKFETNVADNVHLILKNAWGATLLEPNFEGEIMSFTFPPSFKNKSGICTWNLVYNHSSYQEGQINILPDENQPVLETYLGPRSISAGNRDFSMLVIAPTDGYDNPLLDSTRIEYSYQFLENINNEFVHTKNLIGWQRIYSTEKSGQMLVSASYNGINSKEFVTTIYPFIPINFKLIYTRNHVYADGNQQIEFATNSIKDAYDNIVSDGTLVSFVIHTSRNRVLQTSGTTLNGLAKAKMLHPDRKETWQVTAFVMGAAQSNTQTITFETAIKNFDVQILGDNETVLVSDIKSFMNQLVPDGIPVTLTLSTVNGETIEQKNTTSRLGNASFTVQKEFLEKGVYQITIESAGISKVQKFKIE